jgi:NADH:quinone reductase (non-electrogenic)
LDKQVAKKKVLVIGGGFGGVFAAKALARLGRGKLDVELVNANNYFVFQPLLPEVAASSIHSADAVVPLRQLLRKIQVRQAEVRGIDFAEKKVIVVQGMQRIPIDLHYDELVIALGTGVDLKRFPGLPEHALTMKDLSDAHRLRTHIIGCLETADVTEDPAVKQQLLTFVTVGAGFSGVETVAEVRELVRRALKYYTNIKPEEVRFYLIEYANRILPTFQPTSPDMRRGACKSMASRC